MPFADNLAARPRARYELKRRYFHRGYLWPWILIIIVCFVLRFVMFYDITFPFQSSPSSTLAAVRPEEFQSYERPHDNLDGSVPSPRDGDLEIPVIHPMKKKDIRKSKERDQSLTIGPQGQDLRDVENFFLPEENEDEIIEIGVAESQLREIGERIKAVKKFHGQKENAEEMRDASRLKNGKDEILALEQEWPDDDQGQIDLFGQNMDQEKTAEEGEAKTKKYEEDAAEETRPTAAEMEVDEERVVAEEKEANQRWSAEEIEAEERMVAEESEAAEERNAEEDREEAGEVKMVVEELEAAEERNAEEDREEAGGEKVVVEEKKADEERPAEEMEADDERRDAEEREAEEEMMAAKEREADEQRTAAAEEEKEKEADEERRAAKERQADERRRAAEGREVEEARKAAQERVTEEVNKAAQEREAHVDDEPTEERKVAQEEEAEEQNNAGEQGEAAVEENNAQEREADEEREVTEQRKAAQDEQAAEEVRKADEQGETGGEKKGEAEKSATDTTEADETRNDEGQNQASQQRDVEEKSFNEEEQQMAIDQKEETGAVKLEKSTDESKHSEDQNQVEEKGNEEEKQKDSDEENITTPNNQIDSLPAGECDLFDGDWEFDPEGPLYTNSTCFYIRGDHNCMSNGRPDRGYQNWRWKPRGCELPRFDARAFMEASRGKTIGFVGDSLARNQIDSLLCMLSLVEIPIGLQDDDLGARWSYEQHDVTLVAVWSPYLLKESQEGALGFEKGQSLLYLDVLDPVWTSMLPELDIVVLSVGQWYFKPSIYIMQDEVIGCHYCPNLNLTQIGFHQAYSEGLRHALENVAGGEWNGTAIVSSFAFSHAERSPGEEGDQCRRDRPLEKAEFESSFRGVQNEMREFAWGEFNRMMVNAEKKLNNSDMHIDFLDVSKLSLLRADGHPGPFYYAHPFEGQLPDAWAFDDCLHWCLPGPIDTWNELLVKILHKYL